MRILLQEDIRSNYEGFAKLINLATQTEKYLFDNIEVDSISIGTTDLIFLLLTLE